MESGWSSFGTKNASRTMNYAPFLGLSLLIMSFFSRLFRPLLDLDHCHHLLVSLFIHLILFSYGIWHDCNSHLKYTDIDYWVFWDATKEGLLNNGTPYIQSVYRYLR